MTTLKPLALAVRFESTGRGKMPMLVCSESGRPIDFQEGISLNYEGASFIKVQSNLAIPVEEDEDYDEDEDTDYRIGFIDLE